MRLIALFMLPIALSAAAADQRQERTVSEFTRVGVSAPVEVHVTQGPAATLVLEGDAEELARIETLVEDGQLKIRPRTRSNWSWNRKVIARVTARRIDALDVSGSADIHAPALSGESLRVSIAGSGDVRVGGRVEGLTASIAGSGDILAGELDAQDVKVSIAGSGDATVRAARKLSVNVSGSGDVRYFGDPELRKSIQGSGSVRRAGAAKS